MLTVAGRGIIATGNVLMDIFTNDSEVKRFGMLMLICIAPLYGFYVHYVLLFTISKENGCRKKSK